MTGDLRQGFEISGWKVEPLRGAITSAVVGERHLEPKVMEVFVCLAERANEVVTREELLDNVWSNHVAADELLTGVISNLRQALRTEGGASVRIETVPKIGYRLDGNVSQLSNTAPEPQKSRFVPAVLVAAGAMLTLIVVILSGPGSPWSRPGLASISSIAVLPLVNLSGDTEQDYISSGLSQALTVQLGKIDGLDVRSFQSVRQYKDSESGVGKIASELRVDAVLEGSALLVNDRVQITVRLIDARIDELTWAESFDADLRDVLKIHNKIALTVAEQIDLKLSRESRELLDDAFSMNPEAYRLYLKASAFVYELTETSFRRAIAAYQRSIDLEPEFALAHAGLAAAYLYLATWHASADQKEMLSLAKAAADEALRLDGELPDTWYVRAMIRRFEWDWLGADRAYMTLLESNPRHVEGHIGYVNFLTTMGRSDEAVAIAWKLLELDPGSPNALNELAYALFIAGKTGQAIEHAERSLAIDPSFFQSHGILADMYASLGEDDKVLEHLHGAELGHPDPPPNALGIVGRLYALAGDEVNARTRLSKLLHLRRQDDTTSAAAIAEVYLGLGELDNAYEWLQVAFDERDFSLIWLNVDWLYLEAREQDPRFEVLLNRMEIPDW